MFAFCPIRFYYGTYPASGSLSDEFPSNYITANPGSLKNSLMFLSNSCIIFYSTLFSSCRRECWPCGGCWPEGRISLIYFMKCRQMPRHRDAPILS